MTASDPPASARDTPVDVGTVLRGKWRLDRRIGQGAMGAVFAATHRNGRRGAVKVLHPRHAVDADLRRRFLREGYVANRLAHPGAVAVLDDDETADGTAFLVMELLEGQTLAEAVAARPERSMPARDVAVLTDQLLDVLVHAHAEGVVHRDLKPENLFLTREGALKVLDFGIARLLDGSPSGSLATQMGSLMGTPRFMSPEQARGLQDQVDARSDIWSVGAVMFSLLTGDDLYPHATTLQEVLVAAMTESVPSIASCMDIEAPLAHVVDRALAFSRDARWQSARAMQVALRDAYLAQFGVALPGSVVEREPEEAPLPAAPADVAEDPGAGETPPEVGAASPAEPTTPRSFESPTSVQRRAIWPWILVAGFFAALVTVLLRPSKHGARPPSATVRAPAEAPEAPVAAPAPSVAADAPAAPSPLDAGPPAPEDSLAPPRRSAKSNGGRRQPPAGRGFTPPALER